MARKYVWKKADEFSKPIGLTRLMAVAATKVVSGAGSFSITQDGDPITGGSTRVKTLRRFREAISHREIGSVFRVRRGDGKVVFTARAVQVVSEVDSTNGNAHADQFFNWIKANYKQYDPRFAGSYVCKTISGSGTRSQHSYGNADDFFFDTLAHQNQVYEDIKHGKCPVPVAHAISQRNIWEPGSGERYYTGDYHGHLHVDFLPQYSGACGVRN